MEKDRAVRGAKPHATRAGDAAVLDQFRAAMVARDIIPPEPIVADGRLHRCDAAGPRGRGDAAYLLHLDGIPTGGLENWRDGLGWAIWRHDSGQVPLIIYRVMRQRLKMANSELTPERALAQLRRIQSHRVSINAAKPIAGISVINDQQASVYASLKVRKPAQDNQMTLL